MKNPFDLSNQTALVLGAGKTGELLASALEEAGAVSVLSDSDDRLAGSKHRIRIPSHPDQAGSLNGLADELTSRYGRVGILINAWEPFSRQRAVDITPDDWKSYARAPIHAVFASCQIFGRIMLRQGSGSIINLSSVAGSLGMDQTLAFSTGKGGIDQLTRTLGVEWVNRGVRVNGIAGWSEALHGWLEQPWEQRIPAGSMTSETDLAGTAIYLASPASRGVTGQILFVDGGYSAQ